jgi:transcriptional regulator with XRE-family HTH domain
LESHLQNLSTNLSPERVKYFRKDNGWSQELLAKASGLSLRTIQRAEKDGNSSVETQLALSAAFDISPKELSLISPSITVHWKRKNIMQSLIALIIVCGSIVMLFMLAGNLSIYLDFYSILFLTLFTYSSTIIAFGSHGLFKSIKGLGYLFANDISQSPASDFLSMILKKQVIFIYAGSFIAALIGCIAIFSSAEAIASDNIFYSAMAVNILIVLYAAIIAEGIFRPLATKLESRELQTNAS